MGRKILLVILMILSLIYTSQFLFFNFIYYKNSEYQAEYLRKYIENMGPVFIKFGQLLSMHKYWLNNYQYRELAKLRDKVGVPYNIENIKENLSLINFFVLRTASPVPNGLF